MKVRIREESDTRTLLAVLKMPHGELFLVTEPGEEAVHPYHMADPDPTLVYISDEILKKTDIRVKDAAWRHRYEVQIIKE